MNDKENEIENENLSRIEKLRLWKQGEIVNNKPQANGKTNKRKSLGVINQNSLVQQQQQPPAKKNKKEKDVPITILEPKKERLRRANISAENNALSEEREARLKAMMESERAKRKLEEKLAIISKLEEDMQCKDEEIKAMTHAMEATLKDKDDKLREKDAQIVDLMAKVDELSSKLVRDSDIKRDLYNTVTELKGNIRVLVRLRPSLPKEGEDDFKNLFSFSDSQYEGRHIAIHEPPIKNYDNTKEVSKSHAFVYNRVFDGSACQADVFEEVLPMIQSAINGYKVCVFAYGQTGSGKTYTMQGMGVKGIDMLGNDRGIIPRAFSHIFSECADLTNNYKWTFKFHVQVMEIYNESIRDLLGDKDKEEKIEIKLDVDSNESYVSGVESVEILNAKQALDLLNKASKQRASGSTDLNGRSSRSHCVFMLSINGSHPIHKSRSGILNLIDLAGSERLSASGSGRDDKLLKETLAINKSLAALSNVIFALKSHAKHIPYRDSKLTHLLQSSLGGNSAKTLMITNISPALASLPETVNSLRFAEKVNATDINKKCKCKK